MGAHNGDHTAFYLAKGFRVVAIDANLAMTDACARRFGREISDGRLVVLNIGIGATAGTFPFYVNRNTVFSSFNAQLGGRGDAFVETVDVLMLPLAGLFARYAVPYYLKIDIEGHDLEA